MRPKKSKRSIIALQFVVINQGNFLKNIKRKSEKWAQDIEWVPVYRLVTEC